MNKFFVLLLLAVFLGVNSQVVHHRECPTHPIMSPFNPAQYSGRWYEIQRYETATQTDGDCTVSLYTLASPFVFGVQYNMLVGPQPIQINGQSFVSFPDEVPLRGMLSLSFGGPPTTSNYWILGTDFVNYAVVWFCQNINATSSQGISKTNSEKVFYRLTYRMHAFINRNCLGFGQTTNNSRSCSRHCKWNH